MLDALIVQEVWPRPGGVRAMTGWAAFAVECPHRDAVQLQEQAAGEGPVAILTNLEMEESRVVLVGFCDEPRRELYLALREIKGIGRRSALATLDCGETLDILRAVAGQDNGFFRGVPGLGVSRINSVVSSLARHYASALPNPLAGPVQWAVEARDALVQEGVPFDEADQAVVRALAEERPSQASALLQAARRLAAAP